MDIVGAFIAAVALSASPQSFCAGLPSGTPTWLKAHVGEGEGQIAPLVLQRHARFNCARGAKHFSNASGSRLTAGGVYVTGEKRASFKGYEITSGRGKAVLVRPFLPSDGEGKPANTATQRPLEVAR